MGDVLAVLDLRAREMARVGLLALVFLPFPLAAEEWSALPTEAGTATGVSLPMMVAPDAPELNYIGRFDISDAKAPRCEWPGSAVTIRFRGTSLNASIALSENRFIVVVDGRAAKVLKGDKETRAETSGRVYPLVSGLPETEHTVTLFKATETYFGMARFFGFQLNAGARLLPAPSHKHRIEVLGDSISAGAGNESNDRKEHTSAANENAYWTYGAIAARAMDADYTSLAWSGRKLWPNNTLPEIYERTLPSQAGSHWPGDKSPPDVILINLCTNDFGKTNPEEEPWVKAYRDFIARVRKDAPSALIYCAIGPMITDSWPPQHLARTTALKYIKRVVAETAAAGDTRIRFLDFGSIDPADGLGADYHPRVKTHQVMAGAFLAALKSDLHWEAAR